MFLLYRPDNLCVIFLVNIKHRNVLTFVVTAKLLRRYFNVMNSFLSKITWRVEDVLLTYFWDGISSYCFTLRTKEDKYTWMIIYNYFPDILNIFISRNITIDDNNYFIFIRLVIFWISHEVKKCKNLSFWLFYFGVAELNGICNFL